VRLKLVSYNVHGCVGWDGRFDPGRIAAVLDETGGDIVALQEVPTLQRGGQRLLQCVCDSTGLQPVIGSELVGRFAHYGNALLTRFPCARRTAMDLAVGAREPRGAIHADIALDGTTLKVIATHLGLSPGERRMQIRRILAAVSSEVCPVALLGDINEWFTWGRPLRWLHAHFGRPPAPRSFPSTVPTFRLDRVWISRPSVVTSVRAHTSALSRRASDHLPVIASVDVRTTSQTLCVVPENSDAGREKLLLGGNVGAPPEQWGSVAAKANIRGSPPESDSHN
jgi:endonuclease/exonuclease/phosphatase family metal-dependent hydrolase